MNEIHFTISEKNARLLNEVRATLSIISSMGINSNDRDCDQLIMEDLVTVLCSAEEKLQHIQNAMQRA